MNKEKAEELLKDYIKPNGDLFGYTPYVWWELGSTVVTLGDELSGEDIFSIDLLKAIIWWVDNSSIPPAAQTSD
jgi:hypothetical protein